MPWGELQVERSFQQGVILHRTGRLGHVPAGTALFLPGYSTTYQTEILAIRAMKWL